MSISELLLLVNSNSKEPLNFNQYLTDIGTFREKSYVLALENENIFRSMLRKSLTMYAHESIHSIIYNRLTIADIDYIIQLPNLGQILNTFYASNKPGYNLGNVDDITAELTFEKFNILEKKFQEGFGRYFDSQLKTTNCGKWMKKVFKQDCYAEFTTFKELEHNDACNNAIMESEAAQIAVVNSNRPYVESIHVSSVYKWLPAMLSSLSSTYLVMGLTFQNNRISYLFDREDTMQLLASNKQALQVMLKSSYGFQGFVNSKFFANVISNSNVLDVISATFKDYTKGNNALLDAQKSLKTFESAATVLSIMDLCNPLTSAEQISLNNLVNTLDNIINPIVKQFTNVSSLLTSQAMHDLYISGDAETLNTFFSYAEICKQFFAVGGPAGNYALNDPVVILKLMHRCNVFFKYMNEHSTAFTTSNSYTNNNYPFVVTYFSWECSNTTGSTVKVTAKNVYLLENEQAKLHAETVTIEDSQVGGLSGYSGAEDILCAKRGNVNIVANNTSSRILRIFELK